MIGASATASTTAESGAPDGEEANSKPSTIDLRRSASTSPFRLPIRTASGSNDTNSGPTNEPKPDGVGNCGPVSLAGDRREKHSETLEIAEHQFQLPSSYQPSRAAAFQQHFVSHLISSLRSALLYRTKLRSWAFELPTILASAGPTTMYSIRAAAMAYYGILTSDESIQTDACRWYAMGLTCQRSFLQKCAMRRPVEIPTAGDICAPVMFSIFEVVVCTAPSGWIHHLSAAGRMLEMRGPENCRDGTAHMLFRTVRVSSVFIAVTTETPSVFASDSWISIPFSLHPKIMFDKLVDILLQLPDCLARRNQMKTLVVQNPHQSEVIGTELKTRLLLLVSKLDDWWRQYEEEAVEGDGESRQEHLEASEEKQHSPKPIIPNSAPMITLYHSANVIAYSLLSVVSSSHLYELRIVSHINYVLSLAGPKDSEDFGGHGAFLTVFPLKVVCHLAQDEQQRSCAQELLEQLGEKRGLDGICRLAAPVYVQRYQ